MSRTLRALSRVVAPTVVAAALTLTLAAPAMATAVGPQQYFIGNVNGSTTSATILVGCIGPITPGATGHPLPGQYVLATQVPGTTTNVGYTGTAAHAITVTLRLGTSWGPVNTYPVGTLTVYDARLAIPTTLDLPCAAHGTAVFAPTPTSSTARSATVAVTVTPQP